MTFGYIDRLSEKQKTNAPKRKGERTRAKLLLATAVCLDRHGYTDLRSIHITEEAGVSEGTLYVYFSDKNEIVTEVMNDFLAASVWQSPKTTIARSAFENIRETNRSWIETTIANGNLIRAVFQRIEVDPDFAAEYAKMNFSWHEYVASSVLRRYPKGSINKNVVLFAVAALDAMTVDLTRSIFVNNTETNSWKAISPQMKIDDVIDVLSVIWYNVLYPGTNINAELKRPAQFLMNIDGQLADVD